MVLEVNNALDVTPVFIIWDSMSLSTVKLFTMNVVSSEEVTGIFPLKGKRIVWQMVVLNLF